MFHCLLSTCFNDKKLRETEDVRVQRAHTGLFCNYSSCFICPVAQMIQYVNNKASLFTIWGFLIESNLLTLRAS